MAVPRKLFVFAQQTCRQAATVARAPQELRARVRQQVWRLARHGQVRLDGPRTPQLTRLVATLAAVRYADRVVPGARPSMAWWTQEVRPRVADVERAQRPWWDIDRARPSCRRAARVGWAALEEVLHDERAAEGWAQIRDHLPGVRVSTWTRRAWAEFERDPVAFHSLLAEIGGTACAGHPLAASGYLTGELRDKIAATEINTSLLTSTLLGYQAFGVRYALHQERSILGDEMGLGKTVQALAVAAHILAKNPKARVLVVCPAAVLFNWLAEIKAHTRLRTYLAYGDDRDGEVYLWRKRGGLAVTTFGTLDRLHGVAGLALVIVDEAHYAKNPQALRAQTVTRTVRGAERVLYLTGTPMENRVDEFATLVRQLYPGRDVVAEGQRAWSRVEGFRHAVGDVYLRRNQVDVLAELPPRMPPKVEWIRLTDADRRAVDAATNDMAARRATFGEAKRAKLNELLGKARENGHKVLVFSFFRSVLDQLRAELGDAVVGSITGDVTPKNRQAVVDAFTERNGEAVLLAQIGAGGTGLNIQAATMVVMLEPQWTPTIEEQAFARAQRKGQTRPVLVYRLVALDSPDMRVRAAQLGKAALFEEYARPSIAKESDPAATDPSGTEAA